MALFFSSRWRTVEAHGGLSSPVRAVGLDISRGRPLPVGWNRVVRPGLGLGEGAVQDPASRGMSWAVQMPFKAKDSSPLG